MIKWPASVRPLSAARRQLGISRRPLQHNRKSDCETLGLKYLLNLNRVTRPVSQRLIPTGFQRQGGCGNRLYAEKKPFLFYAMKELYICNIPQQQLGFTMIDGTVGQPEEP